MAADPTFDPPALRDQPELWAHLAPYEAAYHELATDRAIGFDTVGPIPWRAIDAYADRYGYDDPDAFDRLCCMIRAQDGVYLDHVKQARSKTPPSKTSPPS